MSIHFGTSGWRAVIADQFTFSNLCIVSQAIAKYLQDQKLQNQGIIVGYDTRFLSKRFALVCAQTVASSKIKVFLTNRDTPTPVIAFQILRKKAGGAINITASHNPPEYNGIKFSPANTPLIVRLKNANSPNYIEIEIKDFGIGIQDEDRSNPALELNPIKCL